MIDTRRSDRVRVWVLWVFACSLGVAACSDDSPSEPVQSPEMGVDAGSDAAEPEPRPECGDDTVERAEIGAYSIVVDASDGSWAVEHGGEIQIEGAPNCERAALRVLEGELDVENEFGAFQIAPEEDSEWLEPVSGIPEIMSDPGIVRLTYTLEDSREVHLAMKLRSPEVTGEDARELEVLVEADDAFTGTEFFTRCYDGESFFGLGTQGVGMDLRGRSYPLWAQEQGNGKPEDGGLFPFNNVPEAAYAPMGIWHSTQGYTALVSHDGYSELDLCSAREDTLGLRSYNASAGFALVLGDTLADRIERATEYTGRVTDEVPDWVFGFWIDAVTGPDRVEEALDAVRDNGIPASAVWSEDWIGGSQTAFGFRLSYRWEWDGTQYPDLPGLVDSAHARGFAFLGYFNPFVPTTVPTHDEGLAGDYFVRDEDGEVVLVSDPAFRMAALVDLTNPEALEWLADYQRRAVIDVGLDGWMADFAEWLPVNARLDDGSTGWEFHNRYPVEWQRQNTANIASAKASIEQPGNWAVFGRSGWASINGGAPQTHQLLWGGDQNTDWEYDDGFPTIIPIAAHAGLSGAAIFGSDIAGYNSVGVDGNTDKELWFRWLTAGAFHPLMRTHHGGDKCNNWNFDRDAQTLAHTRRWASVHGLLLPEFKRLYAEARDRGLPISRHPYLVEPEVEGLWKTQEYQWFLGHDILIAPVLTQGTTQWQARLPAQGWWPLFGDEPQSVEAEMTHWVAELEVPVTEVPVFVRPGTALVLGGDVVDSFYGASVEGVSDLAQIENSYRIALYPDEAGGAQTRPGSRVSVEATGMQGYALDSVELDSTGLSVCVGDDLSCVDGETIILRGVTSSVLSVGSAEIEVEADVPTDVRIGLGAAAWGELSEPTEFEANPDAETWCVDE